MAAKFLLAGLATDGPSNIAFQPKSLRELRSLFGADYRERFYVSQTATSVTMLYEPYSIPLNEVDSVKQYLFAPTLDTAVREVMYFGNIGGTGLHVVDLQYTPYLGKADLLVAAERFYEETGQMPSIVRVGGSIASLEVDGWRFESKYAGLRYNYLGLSCSGSAVTIFGLQPNYPLKTYTYSTPLELKDSINRNFDLGISPVVCTAIGTALMASGTHWFTGGTDGSLSDADVDYLLENYSFPISTGHVVVLKELSSGMVESISSALLYKEQPRMFLVPSISYDVTGSAQEYIDTVALSVPYRHNMISAIVGEITTYHRGERITRFAAEGAAIAFARSGGYNLTNLPVIAESFSPVLSEANLSLLKSAGFMTLMRYIGNDISVYEGTTTYAENSFLYSSKVAEISAIAYNYCFQFFGQVLQDGIQPQIEQMLWSLLSSIEYVEIQRIEVNKAGEEMFVRIEGYLPNEILNISFTVQNR